MDKAELIRGFSKLPADEKLHRVASLFTNPEAAHRELLSHRHPDKTKQQIFSELAENTISNYHLPYSVAPNFLINDKLYHVPMVIEESSVVAAASKSARFWSENGGFHCSNTGMTKKGQVHFIWEGSKGELKAEFPGVSTRLRRDTGPFEEKMKARGGGLGEIRLLDKTRVMSGYYQIDADFLTADAMGANFINTCVEQFAASLVAFFSEKRGSVEQSGITIIMAILSNYTPGCRAKCYVEAPIPRLASFTKEMPPETFAKKFEWAVQIANTDTSRAVTHNKGIYNGVDAVLIATGNDWRAVEAGGHAFAVKGGRYQSLNRISLENNRFHYELEIPLSLGTKGGIAGIHPLAKLSHELLGSPDAEELMSIVAAAGMANNFSAVASLITSGIQKGHMKMHLSNILAQFDLDENFKAKLRKHFSGKPVSYHEIEQFIRENRSQENPGGTHPGEKDGKNA